MESKNPLRHILAISVALVPLLYLALTWQSMPDIVATHFNIHGKADGYESKGWMLVENIIMFVVTLGSYILVYNAHKFDKRLKGQERPARFDSIALGLVVFLSIINLVLIISSSRPDALLDKILIPAIGLFFVFIGNVFYNLRPNRFVGIRVPWTLNNDENWKHTHRLGSKLFFVGGILITLVSLGYEVEVSTIFMTGVVLIITITTVLYSYLYHRKSQNNNA